MQQALLRHGLARSLPSFLARSHTNFRRNPPCRTKEGWFFTFLTFCSFAPHCFYFQAVDGVAVSQWGRVVTGIGKFLWERGMTPACLPFFFLDVLWETTGALRQPLLEREDGTCHLTDDFLRFVESRMSPLLVGFNGSPKMGAVARQRWDSALLRS